MEDSNFWKDIPPTRDDKCCLNCNVGSLGSLGHARSVGKNGIQSAWKCENCGETVILIDEEMNCDCPFCGSPNEFTSSRLAEIFWNWAEYSDFVKNKIVRILHEVK